MKKDKNIELKHPTIKSMIPILEGLRYIYNQNKDNKKTQQKIKRMTNSFLRIAFENVPAKYISEDALRSLPKNLKEEKPYRFPWNLRFKELIYEHCIPLNAIVSDMYDEKKPKSIHSVLTNNLLTAWITKKENDRLDKKYKKTRPNGWKKCYKECHIKLLDKKGNKVELE